DSEQQENNPQPPIVQSEEAKGKSLSSEVLQILGDEPIIKTVLGPPIYEAVVPRWSNILQNGLSEENIQVLLQKHIIPENFKSLEVPQLNPEVKAALTAQILRRDERLVRKQQFVTASISAISQALTLMLAEEGGGNNVYMQYLSNAGRLLCHLHRLDTMTRKDLISINLNKDLKDTLSAAPTDNFLFGQALEERVKAAKNLEKSSEELKQVKPETAKKP
ncbi:hypothetical protein PPYR_15028, partial [Photinus pyralis]